MNQPDMFSGTIHPVHAEGMRKDLRTTLHELWYYRNARNTTGWSYSSHHVGLLVDRMREAGLMDDREHSRWQRFAARVELMERRHWEAA